MRTVAEGLVLRSATTAQRVMLGRGASPPSLACQLDAADDRVRSVPCHRDARCPRRVVLLDAVYRVAQRARRTFADGGDDGLRRGAIRVDPRLAAILKHFGKLAAAISSVRADRAVVVDRYPLAGICIPSIALRIGKLRARKADLLVRAVAERLAGRRTAAAERKHSLRRDDCTVRAPQVWQVLHQVRAVRLGFDTRRLSHS